MRKILKNELVKKVQLDKFNFETTEEIEPVEEIIGQERALKALYFGVEIEREGYNIFVSGLPGTGRTSTVMNVLKEYAEKLSPPADWCYVYNFEKPNSPVAISLPAGKAKEFEWHMNEFIKNCKEEISKVFDTEDYLRETEEIVKSIEQEKMKKIIEASQKVESLGFILQRGTTGFTAVPAKDKRPMTQEEFSALPEEERERLKKNREEIQKILDDLALLERKYKRKVKNAVEEHDKKVVLHLLTDLIEPLEKKYQEHKKILHFFHGLKNEIIKNTPLLKEIKNKKEFSEFFKKFRINVIVDNSSLKGAPVILELNPNYYKLFGRIEYRNIMGNMITDFSMIKGGLLHRANGGYLVLNASSVVTNALIWSTLKTVLEEGKIKIENIPERVGGTVVETLDPEPIPLKLKIVLIGTPLLYNTLYAIDEEFRTLFRVRVDFDTSMPRNHDTEKKYISFVTIMTKKHGLLPFTKGALGRIIEFGARLAENKNKLSTRFNKIADIVFEADYWARINHKTKVEEAEVIKAIEEKIYRSRMYQDKIEEMIEKGEILFEMEGEKIGQVNGLSIIRTGDYEFGRPIRITARTYVGKEGVVNIEREIEMSGVIHNKAILIITGYLGGKFANKRPLTLSASICFEQLYDEIEGDSASAAELYALLSSIAKIPLKQSIAVTGSVSQFGEVQPVGGINEKIEGFFDVCKKLGLNGQGVIIPERNLENLMLKDEILEAVERGLFNIYAIKNVEEGIEILSGMKTGEIKNGEFEEGTFFYHVDKGLEELTKRMKEQEK